MPSTAKNPKRRWQFSLRTMMLLMTVICIMLAIPTGYILLGVIVSWVILGMAILGILIAFQYPLYRILSGIKRSADEE